MKKLITITIFLLSAIWSTAQKYELKQRGFSTVAVGVEAQYTIYDRLNHVQVRKIIYSNGTWRITTDRKTVRHSDLIISDDRRTYYLFSNGTWVKK